VVTKYTANVDKVHHVIRSRGSLLLHVCKLAYQDDLLNETVLGAGLQIAIHLKYSSNFRPP